jgi:predicted PhzF superfamily epimerase YddE/YHI9
MRPKTVPMRTSTFAPSPPAATKTPLAPRRYVASQGTVLGRKGRVHVEQDGVDIWVGGAVTTCIAGTLTL